MFHTHTHTHNPVAQPRTRSFPTQYHCHSQVTTRKSLSTICFYGRHGVCSIFTSAMSKNGIWFRVPWTIPAMSRRSGQCSEEEDPKQILAKIQGCSVCLAPKAFCITLRALYSAPHLLVTRHDVSHNRFLSCQRIYAIHTSPYNEF